MEQLPLAQQQVVSPDFTHAETIKPQNYSKSEAKPSVAKLQRKLVARDTKLMIDRKKVNELGIQLKQTIQEAVPMNNNPQENFSELDQPSPSSPYRNLSSNVRQNTMLLKVNQGQTLSKQTIRVDDLQCSLIPPNPKIPLTNKKYKENVNTLMENLENDEISNSFSEIIKPHFISDRIEKNIQKFSKQQQIYKSQIGHYNHHHHTSHQKSRNVNNSFTYQQMSHKPYTNPQFHDLSPYINSQNYYSYNSISQPSDLQQQQQQQQQQHPATLDQSKYMQNISSIGDYNFQNQNDLSFESLNPINNSFTSGQFDMQFNNFMQSVQNQNHKFKHVGPTKNDLVSKSERELTTAASSIIKNPGVNSQMSMGGAQRNADDQSSQIQINIIPDNSGQSNSMNILNNAMHKSMKNSQNQTINYNPFNGPKLHLYKKSGSRRIKTSSATRNLNIDAIFSNNNSNLLLPNSQQSIPLHYEGDPYKQNDHSYLKQCKNMNEVQKEVSKNGIGNQLGKFHRPNTTNLEQGKQHSSLHENSRSHHSPDVVDKIQSSNNNLKQTNGFKHSFYNNSNKVQDHFSTTKPDSQQDHAKQELHQTKRIEYDDYKSQGVKQIFVCENMKKSDRNSKANSSTMTPCFSHTPNRTNQWNNFNPHEHQNQQSEREKDLMKDQLFKQAIKITSLNQHKKPQTSHHAKSVGKYNSHNEINSQMNQLNDNNNSNSNNCNELEKININDISLNAKVLGLSNGKPRTSGNSFRRPLSRNHPILNIVQSKTNKTHM